MKIKSIPSCLFKTLTILSLIGLLASCGGGAGNEDVSSWPRVELPEATINISYPPIYTPQQPSLVGAVYEVVFANSLSSEEFAITSFNTTLPATSIIEWADIGEWPFPSNWRDFYEEIDISGVAAIRDPVTGSIKFMNGSTIISIENGVGREDKQMLDSQTFASIVQSINIQ